LLAVRFDQASLQSHLFHRFVNLTAPMDLRYMRALALNMAKGVLQRDPASLPDKTLPSKMTQLLADVENLLSLPIIEAREEAFLAMAGQSGEWVHRNPVVRDQQATREVLERQARGGGVGVSILESQSSSSSKRGDDK